MRRNSSPTSVNVDSNNPSVETGHQSEKRVVMRINHKSDVVMPLADCYGHERNVRLKHRKGTKALNAD